MSKWYKNALKTKELDIFGVKNEKLTENAIFQLV